MFPTINHLDDLLPYIADNQQIRVKQEPNGLTVVCYMLQDEDTFAGPNLQFERECRGITFNPDGTIAARTLHKFFNIGEREDTQASSIDWARVVRIMDKRDGSMITPVLMPDGSIVCKTKKTFTSAEAIEATKFINADQARVDWCHKWLLNGYTPTFEWTSPRFPIVLRYEKDELTLLHIRTNHTGEYMDLNEGPHYGVDDYELMPFPIVENMMHRFTSGPSGRVSWELLKHAAETTEGVEGWIIQFDDGEMMKLKTKWYCELHHAVTFTRWRDIARAVCDDKADDLKGAFAMTGRSIEPILQVERQIKARLDSVKRLVATAVEYGVKSNFDAKAMALKFKEHNLFGLIMTQFRGKEPDYMAWYVRNHLEAEWNLEVVEVNA